MRFVKSESKDRPQEIENISGGRCLIRKNIVQETRTGTDGEEFSVFVYDEAVASELEGAAYSAVENSERKRETEIVDEYTLTLIEEGVL